MTTPGPRASVVIPTFQRCVSLRRLLDALGRQRLPASCFEVVVAIDGSEDGTREMAAGFAAPYSLRALWQPNRGRAAACNLGLRQARGEVVVILDDDMEPAVGWLAAHLDRHSAAERLGVLGAVPIAVESATPPVARFVAAKFNAHLERLGRAESAISVRDFYSGNFSVRRDVLLELGGFDERFRIYGNEDGELAVRLQLGGVRLVYSPEAEARQHYEKDFTALARDYLAKGRTAVVCACKHPSQAERIAARSDGSRRWRAVRRGLLAASTFSHRTPGAVMWLVRRLERRRAPSLFAWYRRALDYFYWLGVESELGERMRAGEEPALALRERLRPAR